MKIGEESKLDEGRLHKSNLGHLTGGNIIGMTDTERLMYQNSQPPSTNSSNSSTGNGRLNR